MIITLQWLRDREACYFDDDATAYQRELLNMLPREGCTPLELCDCEAVPIADRLWVLLHDDVIGRAALIEFSNWCADRAKQYEAADAVYTTAAAARATAAAAASANANAADAAFYAAEVADLATAFYADEAGARLTECRCQLDAVRRMICYGAPF